MKIKVTQNTVGRFNFLGNEETLSFRMCIFDDEGNVVEEDGIKAILAYSGDPDEKNIFEDVIENIGHVFNKCFDYSKGVISSTDYEKQCLLFLKLYKENFEKIRKSYIEIKTKEIKEEIDRLQRKVSTIDMPNGIEEIEGKIKNEIDKYNKWIGFNKEEILQYKEGSEKITELKNKNKEYEKKIITLQNLIK